MESKKDKPGTIYVLEDSVFPDHIRFGYTADLSKKLKYFEENKPYKTCRVIYNSDEVDSAARIYGQITSNLMDSENYKFESGLSKGWHSKTNKQLLASAIQDWLDK